MLQKNKHNYYELFYLFSSLWLFNILPFSYPFLQFSHVGSTEIYSQIKNLNKFYWRLINNPNKKGSVSYGKLSWYLQSLLSSHIFLHLQNLSQDHQYPPWRRIIKAEENNCRPDYFQCDNHPPASKSGMQRKAMALNSNFEDWPATWQWTWK